MADTFDIVTQEPTTTLGDTGRVEVATQITFRTKPSKITGRIVIPASRFNAEQVGAMVADAAAEIERVQNL